MSSLNQTNHQDREDLSQEIKMKLLLCIKIMMWKIFQAIFK
ncbi:MAG: hypothetical protein ACQEV7_16035 [Bacillota bacterium]